MRSFYTTHSELRLGILKVTKDMKALQGKCKSASLCMPVEGVKILSSAKILAETDCQGVWRIEKEKIAPKIRFEKNGYIPKEYREEELEDGKVIRLLEDRIIGYSNKLSYCPGETIFFHIHSSNKFRAELVRYGYEVKVVKEFEQQPVCMQQVPDGKFVEQGLDWNVSMKIQLTEDMRPGLWALRLYDGLDKYGITFVLSTPKERAGRVSNIVVLASDTTWRSYNVWGGRSRYRNFEDLSIDTLPQRINKALKALARKILPACVVQLLKKIAGSDTPLE